MEIRRRRGVADILVYPIKDGSGNYITGLTGITPQIATWTNATTTEPAGFRNIGGGCDEIGTTGVYFSSLSAVECTADMLYFIASPVSGLGRRVDLLLNLTAVASVTNVGSISYAVPLNWASISGANASQNLTSTRIASVNYAVGLNWGSITNPAAGQSLSGTLVGTATNVSTVDHVRDLRINTYAEVAAPPAASSTIFDRIGWMYAMSRNKIQVSSVTQVVFDLAGEVTTISFATHSDAAGLLTRNEWK